MVHRHRQFQICLYIFKCSRDLAGILGISLDARFQRSIFARNVGVRVECIRVPVGIRLRLDSDLAPEQVFVDLCDKVIALEPLPFIKIGVAECGSLSPLGFQACYLICKSRRGPVRKFSVKFVTSLIHREVRVSREVARQKLIDILIPFSIGCGRLVSVGVLIHIGSLRLAAGKT